MGVGVMGFGVMGFGVMVFSVMGLIPLIEPLVELKMKKSIVPAAISNSPSKLPNSPMSQLYDPSSKLTTLGKYTRLLTSISR